MISVGLHLVAVFSVACMAASLAVGGLARARREWLRSLEPASRARVLFAALSGPPFLAALIVAGVAFPHDWLGMADHCLDHPGHLHLCFVHGAPSPDWTIRGVATLTLLRLARRAVRGLGAGLQATRAVRGMLRSARLEGDVHVLAGDAPIAFTVGLVRPVVVVSAGVLRDRTRWRAVLEHERAHARERHPLARWIAEGLSVFHWPWIGVSLAAQLREAQEIEADERAAAAVGCRVEVAEALVDWMRWVQDSRQAVGLGFHSGPFEVRVRRLLDPTPDRPGPTRLRILSTGALALAIAMLGAPSLHHAVETALGLLLS